MSRGPLVTLVAALGLALALLVVNRFAAEPGPSDLVAAGTPSVEVVDAAPPAVTPSAEPPPVTPTTPAVAPLPARARFVGDVATADGPIPIAITVDGTRAKAYLCDNAAIEVWFQGTARDGVVDAAGRHDAHLAARFGGSALTGTVRIAGHPEWTFTAAPAGGNAGLYRRSAGGTTAGWIVREDGRQVGLRHDATGAVSPAIPLPPAGPLPPGVGAVDAGTDVLADETDREGAPP